MSPDAVFSIANTVAAMAWLLLAAAPRWRWARAAAGAVVPAGLATLYTAVIATTLWHADGGFSSLAAVAALFGDRWLLLAGWVHYLAFDLLVGAWEARDAQQRGMPQWRLVPCLALTFLFGPAGWLLYMALRAARGTSPIVHEA